MILAELNSGQATSSNRRVVEIACSQGQAAQEAMGYEIFAEMLASYSSSKLSYRESYDELFFLELGVSTAEEIPAWPLTR